MADNATNSSQSKEKKAAKIQRTRNLLFVICLALGAGSAVFWFAFGLAIIAFPLGGACIIFALLGFDAIGHEYEVRIRPDKTMSQKRQPPRGTETIPSVRSPANPADGGLG